MHTATKKSGQIDISSEKKLEEFASSLIESIKQGDIFFLYGEMGVGKTTFVKLLINKLQLKFKQKTSEVTSPTFNIMNEYTMGNFAIKHYDLYRIKKVNELNYLGIFSENEKTIKIIEWPDLIKIPLANKLEIHLEYGENDRERKMKIYGLSKWKDFENEI